MILETIFLGTSKQSNFNVQIWLQLGSAETPLSVRHSAAAEIFNYSLQYEWLERNDSVLVLFYEDKFLHAVHIQHFDFVHVKIEQCDVADVWMRIIKLPRKQLLALSVFVTDEKVEFLVAGGSTLEPEIQKKLKFYISMLEQTKVMPLVLFKSKKAITYDVDQKINR